jgi:sec-independent protein translocase protein TatC
VARNPLRRGEGRREKKPWSRRHNPDGTMSLRDHIYELRHRLGLALLIVLGGGVLGFLWFNFRVGPIPSLGNLLLGPYCALPPASQPGGIRFEPSPGVCQLLQTQPFEAFLIQFKVGVAAGMVLTSPLWIYQVWAFIAPGLYARERKFALTFVGFASVLFAAGAVLAYFVVPKGLEVLTGAFGGGLFATALAGDKYISFVLTMLVIFGVCFELPLLVIMLNRIGILPYENLKRWRRGILFALFVFAAFVTPGTDPVSMIALSISMGLLFELAVQISRIHDRRKARREAEEGLEGLSDDEASPLDLTPEPVPPPDPVPSPDTKAGLDDVT